MKDTCDIIIPVYNGLDYVSACLESIRQYTDYPYAVILVDDGSDDYVRKKLQQFETQYSDVRVLHSDANVGFIQSVNRGLQESTGKYVVLLNSDTHVTSGWLRRMITCAESDERIMVVNPISNMAALFSVQIPPGFNLFTMSQTIAAISKRTYPDMVTAIGFCLLLRRKAIETFGNFDDAYGAGYGEESDYCMRVVTAGYRVVLADDAFVYHKGCATFGSWLERYATNRKIFDRRWGKAFTDTYKHILTNNPLDAVRTRLIDGLAVSKTDPALVKAVWDMGIMTWRGSGMRGIIRRLNIIPRIILRTLKKIVRQLFSMPSISEDPTVRQKFIVTESYLKNMPEGAGLKIAYLVNGYRPSEGMMSILQLTNEIIRQGHTAYLISLSDEPDPGAMNLYTRPMRYPNAEAIAEYLPAVDIVISTSRQTTNSLLPGIKRKNPHLLSLYYMQEIDERVHRKQIADKREKLFDVLDYADHCVVTTRRMAAILGTFSCSAHTIQRGINFDIFYPRKSGQSGNKRIFVHLGIAQSGSDCQRLNTIIELLSSKRLDITAVLYGFGRCRCRQLKHPFEYIDADNQLDLNEKAEKISSCDVSLSFESYDSCNTGDGGNGVWIACRRFDG